MSESVTSEDFQALIAELKKTNKQLSQQKRGGLVAAIKKKIEDVKDSVTSPFKRIKETIAAPGKFIGDTIENVGDAVMSPFESFKNVSEGFKNIFSKNETERQTKLLEQILQGIEDLNQNVSVNTNREQNQDLIKLEQGKEQKTIFRSISDNIKNAGVGAGGRGARRKGKGGSGGGGDRGFFANMAQDFFLAAIVTQRGIGEFISDIKKNVVDSFKAVAKPFTKVFGGVKKLGGGAINLAKDVFGKEKGQKGIPFRRAVVKEKVSSVVSSFKDKAQGLKEELFPNKPKQLEALPAEGGFNTNNLFSADIVEAVKENTSSLVKVLTGNDLKKAETEKERDKTFQNIADSLEDIEGGGDNQLGTVTKDKSVFSTIVESIKERFADALAIGGGALLFSKKARSFAGKKVADFGRGVVDKGKGLFSRLNPFSGKKAPTGAPLNPSAPRTALPGPVKTIVDAGKAGQDASSRTIKNITNAPGSSVVGAPKPSGLSRFIPKRLRRAGTLIAGTAGLAKDKISSVAGLAKDKISSVNPMQKIKDATKPIAKQFPSILKRVPVIGGVVEGIFLNSAIKTILENPEASEDEKKDAVGTEFIKALTGPAGAAIAIGAVTAATGGVGLLASAVTGTAGYAVGNVVGGVLASVLPTKTIGGAIINTFYKKESAQGQTKPQTTTQNPVKVALEEAKMSGIDMTSSGMGGIDMTSSGMGGIGAATGMGGIDMTSSGMGGIDMTSSGMGGIGKSSGMGGIGKSSGMGGIGKSSGMGGIDMTSSGMGGIEKSLNTTGAEMLGTMRTSSNASADINTRMIENRNASSNTSVVNAPTNSNITTINEAPNHIDRTTSMFGGQLAY